METLELNIEVNVGNQTVTCRRENQSFVEGKFAVDPIDKQIVGVFLSALGEGRINEKVDLQGFGSMLFRILFAERASTALDLALYFVENENATLRIRLKFVNDEYGVGLWPWEFLYYPKSQYAESFFFAAHPRILFSRWFPLAQMPRPITASPDPLRVMWVTCTGKGLKASELITESAQAAVADALDLRTIHSYKLVDKDRVEFLAAIKEFNPHVLHVCAVGRPRINQSGYDIAMLCDKSGGGSQLMSGESLVELIQTARVRAMENRPDSTPLAIVLDLRVVPPSRPLVAISSFVRELIKRNVQAVVGMHCSWDAVVDGAVFCKNFYSELADGAEVDMAVQKARNELGLNDTYAAASRISPFLFLQSTGAGFVRKPVDAGFVSNSAGPSASPRLPSRAEAVAQSNPL